jgi:hypothetical protein
MNKLIQINPELLKFSSSGNRKKATEPKELKIKIPKENNSTLGKRNKLLKFIRRHQDSNTKTKSDDSSSIEPVIKQSDFDESIKYLMDMSEQLEKNKNDVPRHNYTLKNQNNDHENVSMVFPELTEPIYRSPNPLPKYGCLKYGGILPTFRQYHNQQTQKNLPQEHLERIIPQKKPSIVNQKKTLRRTFHIGKSNANQKVSVLVSNKTIRKRISNENIVLKQTPMIEVRRYLVKHGFIKIGSISPPDVLRQMFESASLMCGNVTNHNSETLMYNFLNSDKKSW